MGRAVTSQTQSGKPVVSLFNVIFWITFSDGGDVTQEGLLIF